MKLNEGQYIKIEQAGNMGLALERAAVIKADGHTVLRCGMDGGIWRIAYVKEVMYEKSA